MKKLISIRYSAGAFNAAVLFLRLGLGLLMMHHGYSKLTNFSHTSGEMAGILGLSGSIAAALVIFAEFFCSLFVIIGLFTRFAVVPLIIVCLVAVIKVHHSEVYSSGELASVYFLGYFTLLFVGPGKVSVDSMIA